MIRTIVVLILIAYACTACSPYLQNKIFGKCSPYSKPGTRCEK